MFEWLRARELFVPGSAAFKALGATFSGKRKDVKTEEGRKFIKAGAFGGGS